MATNSAGPDSVPASYPGYGSKGYRAYVLGALFVVYTINFLDRGLIGVLQEPIKEEFGLSDFQLGLLGGPAFAIFYSLLGVPIARIAEHKNRVTVLSISIGIWSAMTAVCGLAAAYVHLFLARVGVGIGEAGCTPPAHSMISDYFPANRRATALAIYTLGAPVGALLASLLGGLIATVFGWREAFLILGLPGLIIAVIVRFTVKEPPRAGPAIKTPSLVQALKELLSKPTFRHVLAGSTVGIFISYGVGLYSTSFLMRGHELSLLNASQIGALMSGTAAITGTFFGGYLVDKLTPRFPRAILWLPVFTLLMAVPSGWGAYLAPHLVTAVAFLVIGGICHNVYSAPMYAITQGVVQPRMRATAIAVFLLTVNLIGYGLGPPFVGWLSDTLTRTWLEANAAGIDCTLVAAEDVCRAGRSVGLRTSMALVSTGYAWAALHFFLARKTLHKDWAG